MKSKRKQRIESLLEMRASHAETHWNKDYAQNKFFWDTIVGGVLGIIGLIALSLPEFVFLIIFLDILVGSNTTPITGDLVLSAIGTGLIGFVCVVMIRRIPIRIRFYKERYKK